MPNRIRRALSWGIGSIVIILGAILAFSRRSEEHVIDPVDESSSRYAQQMAYAYSRESSELDDS